MNIRLMRENHARVKTTPYLPEVMLYADLQGAVASRFRLPRLSQLVLTGIACVVMKSNTPEVVVFDMKGTIDLFMQQSAQLQMDESKARLLTTRFNAALTDSLDAWQAEHNAIILVKPAVMSPQTDITAEIQQDIARRVKEGQ